MIDAFGTDEQRKDWVPRLATMDIIVSLVAAIVHA
jgi:alkylation response protein AidB-like acyl-CoA dehydrogenase